MINEYPIFDGSLELRRSGAARKDVVPNAEAIEPEPGNPDVGIRVIREAVLREFSVVTSPAYEDAGVDLRSEDFSIVRPRRRVWL